MKAPMRRSVIPDARVLIEEWETAAAGIDESERLHPSIGFLVALGLSVPVDLVLIWILPW